MTRRRPIGRDYAAAKDAECGMEKNWELGMRNDKECGSRNAECGMEKNWEVGNRKD